MLAHPNTRSHSTRVISPRRNAKTAHLAPTGKPHKTPMSTAMHPALGRYNNWRKGSFTAGYKTDNGAEVFRSLQDNEISYGVVSEIVIPDVTVDTTK